MILRKTLALTCTSFLLVTACSDDPNDLPKEQFTFADKEINLEDANFYLVNESTFNNTHIYRDYSITDGIFSGGDGWGMEDYTGATYYIGLELAVPIADNEIGPGKYPVFENWDDQDDQNANIGYFFSEMGTDLEYVELGAINDVKGNDNIIVSGGVDEGDVMTLKYNGALEYNYFDGVNWVSVEAPSKLFFKGKIDDVRNELARISELKQIKKAVKLEDFS